MTERRAPLWRPLRDLVGEEVVGDFMWMFELELSDKAVLQAYKHMDTEEVHPPELCPPELWPGVRVRATGPVPPRPRGGCTRPGEWS